MKQLFIIIFIMSTACLYSQIPPNPTASFDLVRGNVKRMEISYCYPKKWKPAKVISEYDSLRRIVSNVNHYIKGHLTKDFFNYDSLGNIVLWNHYTDQNECQKYRYTYRYDSIGRIVTQIKSCTEKWNITYDSIVYNEDNLIIQYTAKYPSSSERISIRYTNGKNNNEKMMYIKKMTASGMADIIEDIRLYNEHGFLTKKIQKTITHINWNDIKNYSSKHLEEYDYVDYKYDKQGNWTERKWYLNWEGRGRKFHLKEKRKIEYNTVY